MPEGKMSKSEKRDLLLGQKWEEVRHRGQVIGYLNPGVMMSHPTYNLEQAWEAYLQLTDSYDPVKVE